MVVQSVGEGHHRPRVHRPSPRPTPARINMASTGNGTTYPSLRRALQGDGRASTWSTCPIAAMRRRSPISWAARSRCCSTACRPRSSTSKPAELRALAVTSAERSPVLPDMPTVGDFVPGYEASAFFGICAPAATPREIVEKLNREINASLARSAHAGAPRRPRQRRHSGDAHSLRRLVRRTRPRSGRRWSSFQGRRPTERVGLCGVVPDEPGNFAY